MAVERIAIITLIRVIKCFLLFRSSRRSCESVANLFLGQLRPCKMEQKRDRSIVYWQSEPQ